MIKRPDYSDVVNKKTAKQKKEESIKERVYSDIETIDAALISDDEEELKLTHMLIEGKYSSCIPNLGHSMYAYFDKYGFNYELIGLESLKHNLILMKAKLQGYVCDFPVKVISALPQNNINVSVPITNETNINITFEEAKQKIEDMPGLTEADTEEIKSKIDDLENITKETISKKKKWEKVKPILAFAIDKGADVAIAFMTIIMQMKLGM